MLLIGEPDLEGAIGEERQHDHGDEQSDIFDEQPAAHDRRAVRRTGSAGAIRRVGAWARHFFGRRRLSFYDLSISAAPASFDHLVGAREQRCRNFQADGFCGFQY